MQMNYDPNLLDDVQRRHEAIQKTSILDTILKKFRKSKRTLPIVESSEWEIMQMLQSISKSLRDASNLDETLQLVGQSVIRLAGTDSAGIYMWNDLSMIDCMWSDRLSWDHITFIESGEGSKILSHWLKNNRMVVVPDMSLRRSKTLVKGHTAFDRTGAVYLIPLVDQGRLIGAIGCYYDQPHVIPLKKVDALMMLSDHASISLKHMDLKETLEGRYIEVSRRLSCVLDTCGADCSGSMEWLEESAAETATTLGCQEEEIGDLKWAARLHDIGKAVVPKKILRKDGPLSEEEWVIIRQHPVEAERLLKPLPQFRGVGRIIRSLREHFDGSGYPDGLAGTEIPIESRILSISDAYENMTRERSFQKPVSHEEAVEELRHCCNGQFDPGVVEAFLESGHNGRSLPSAV